MGDDRAILKRLEELESQLAFQDELYQQLNDVVACQDREIIRLKEKVRALARRLKDLGESIPGQAVDPDGEVPPHY